MHLFETLKGENTMQTLGFVAAFYLLTKPPSCLLFHLKTAPKTPPDSAVCLSAPSCFLPAAQVDVFICQGVRVWGMGKMWLILKQDSKVGQVLV